MDYVSVLRLSHNKKQKVILFERGMSIIVRTENGHRIKGFIRELEDNSIQVDGHQIPLQKVVSITHRNPKTSWLRFLGGLSMFIGTILTALTLIALPKFELNRYIWVAILVFLLPSLLLIFLGSLPFLRNTYNIRKRYKAEMIP